MRALKLSGWRCSLWMVSALMLPTQTPAAVNGTGLWVGEAILNRVNETVVGIDAANNVVAPDPSATTPVQYPAHIKVILHVDGQGQVRLLNSVAILSKGTNQPPNLALVTDASLYPNFNANGVGKRVASAAFDFGDSAAYQVVTLVASNAAFAAAAGADPTNAANLVVQNAAGSVPPAAVTPGFTAFIATPAFLNCGTIAAGGAAAGALLAAGQSSLAVQNLALASALKALTDNGVIAAADEVVDHEVKLSGVFAPAGTLTGTIYLGAGHPTNPFRHFRHPDHTTGYAITRNVTVSFNSSSSTNVFQSAGFGVDTISGTYREEITGLHKPLGTQGNIGLITEGVVTLNRISAVAALNQ